MKVLSTLALAIATLGAISQQTLAQQPIVDLDCDPCIDRSNYRLQAIYHGRTVSAFWKQVADPAAQAARDLGIPIDIKLFETFDSVIMAAEVRAILTDPPSALIVSIPDLIVADAVREVVAAGIPVFGLNSGYKDAQDLGVLAWVAQDDIIAGEQAAEAYLRTSPVVPTAGTRVAFVNPESGNQGFADRLTGFNSFLRIAEVGIAAEELILEEDIDLTEQLNSLLGDCSYDFVVTASSGFVGVTLDVLDTAGCSSGVGSFDQSQAIFDGILNGRVAFGMSQQQFLQGAIPVILAGTYVTTGKVPAIPTFNPNGIYLSNGIPWTSQSVPRPDRQLCIEDSFPVCPEVGEAGCPCFDRSAVRIGGVLHGDTADAFWDNVFAGAAIGAQDMGIQLDLNRLEPSASTQELTGKMIAELTRLCDATNPVDALFVSIPNTGVVPAVEACQNTGIPVIVVNSGNEEASALNVNHFLGQAEFNSGFLSAEKLIEAGMVRGWCLNGAAGVSITGQRCSGFEAGIVATNGAVSFIEEVFVDPSNNVAYVAAVEDAVGDPIGTWAGNGFLLAGGQQALPSIQLVSVHPQALLGIYDSSQLTDQGLDFGTFQFAINQQPYLQGYMPIPLLTYYVQARRQLVNFFIESGPSFELQSHTPEEQVCEASDFELCVRAPTPTPTPSPTPPTEECGEYAFSCISGLQCCSSRCALGICQKQIPIAKAKIANGRGGAASAGNSRPGVRGNGEDRMLQDQLPEDW